MLNLDEGFIAACHRHGNGASAHRIGSLLDRYQMAAYLHQPGQMEAAKHEAEQILIDAAMLELAS